MVYGMRGGSLFRTTRFVIGVFVVLCRLEDQGCS